MYYYILLDPDKPNKCKVGITKNLEQRLRSYRTANPNCTFYATYNLPHKIHEKKILDILKEGFVVRSEYIHCNPQIVNNIVSSYFNELNNRFND